MRFFHLSDLHIGRQLHHYSLLEDQWHILNEVIGYVEQMHPQNAVASVAEEIFMTNRFHWRGCYPV